MMNHLKLRLKEGKRIQTWPQMVESGALELGPLPISKSDRFFVMGSCFVNEIRHFLEKDGVEVYPKLQQDIRDMFPDVLKVKAAWGDWDERVHYQNYTPFSIDQEIDVALGEYELSDDAIVKVGSDYWDPYRKDVRTPSAEQTLAIRRRMSAAIKDGLEKANVAIITAGAIESFLVKGFGGEVPEFRGALHKSLDFREHTVEETEACLTRICDKLLNRYGFREIILTVSPIPMGRTHRQVEVALANAYSKSVLRVCVEQVVRKMRNVHYFPSYEFVTIKGGYRTNDYLHIRSEVVGEITSAFQASFAGQASIEPIDHSRIITASFAQSAAAQSIIVGLQPIAPIDHSKIISASSPKPTAVQPTAGPAPLAPIDHSKIVSAPLGRDIQPRAIPAFDHSKIISAPPANPLVGKTPNGPTRVERQPAVAVQNNKAPTTSVADYAARGVKAFKEEKWKDAVLNFEAASHRQPKNTRHLRAAAEAHFRAGDKPSALLLLARALQIASNNEKVSRNVSRRILEMSRPGWINLIRRPRPFPVD